VQESGLRLFFKTVKAASIWLTFFLAAVFVAADFLVAGFFAEAFLVAAVVFFVDIPVFPLLGVFRFGRQTLPANHTVTSV